MESMFAFLGWKYVKSTKDGKFHHYKCQKMNGLYSSEKYMFSGIIRDLEKNSSYRVCDCIQEHIGNDLLSKITAVFKRISL